MADQNQWVISVLFNKYSWCPTKCLELEIEKESGRHVLKIITQEKKCYNEVVQGTMAE